MKSSKYKLSKYYLVAGKKESKQESLNVLPSYGHCHSAQHFSPPAAEGIPSQLSFDKGLR